MIYFLETRIRNFPDPAFFLKIPEKFFQVKISLLYFLILSQKYSKNSKFRDWLIRVLTLCDISPFYFRARVDGGETAFFSNLRNFSSHALIGSSA